jgi:hypothetical protein
MTSMSRQRFRHRFWYSPLQFNDNPPLVPFHLTLLPFHSDSPHKYPIIYLAHSIDCYHSSLLAQPITTTQLITPTFTRHLWDRLMGCEYRLSFTLNERYQYGYGWASSTKDPSGLIEQSREYCGHIRRTRIVHILSTFRLYHCDCVEILAWRVTYVIHPARPYSSWMTNLGLFIASYRAEEYPGKYTHASLHTELKSIQSIQTLHLAIITALATLDCTS